MSPREGAKGEAWAARPRIKSVRRRRLRFVASIAPGVFLAVLGVELGHHAAVVFGGVLLVGAALIGRQISERRFLARQAALVLGAASTLPASNQELAS